MAARKGPQLALAAMARGPFFQARWLSVPPSYTVLVHPPRPSDALGGAPHPPWALSYGDYSALGPLRGGGRLSCTGDDPARAGAPGADTSRWRCVAHPEEHAQRALEPLPYSPAARAQAAARSSGTLLSDEAPLHDNHDGGLDGTFGLAGTSPKCRPITDAGYGGGGGPHRPAPWTGLAARLAPLERFHHAHALHSQPMRRAKSTLAGGSPGAPGLGASLTPRLFDALQLTTFTEAEISRAFDTYDVNGDGVLQQDELAALLTELYGEALTATQREVGLKDLLAQFDANQDGLVSREEFQTKILELGSQVDPRVWNIAGAMIMTGTSIGVLTPVLPLLIQQMDISTGQFGLLTSTFCLVKLLGNVPCAWFADRHGRKPLLTWGLAVLGLGVGGIGLAANLEHLYLCRAVSGFGVAMLTTGASLYMSDISTPLNRARTMAPMTAGFSGGTAVGPALGGLMVNSLGVKGTFLTVGSLYSLLVLANRSILKETMPPKGTDAGAGNASATASRDGTAAGPPSGEDAKAELGVLEQWREILRHDGLRWTIGLHGAYWYAFSGSQMTLLPMLLVSDNGHAFSVGEMGLVFAGMSLVNVLGAQPMAALSDKVGRATVMVAGCGAFSTCMALLPLAQSKPELAGVLTLWSLAVAGMSTAPTAQVVDYAPVSMRAQALALQRVAGDVGMLFGAALAGAVADASGMETAFHTNAGILTAVTAWFLLRRLVDARRGGLPAGSKAA